MKQEIGSLMYIYREEIHTTETSDRALVEKAKAAFQMDERNWIPVVVVQTGQEEYKAVANGYILEAAEELDLTKIWVIIAGEQHTEAAKAMEVTTTEQEEVQVTEKEEASVEIDKIEKILRNPPAPNKESDLGQIKRICSWLHGAPAKISYFELVWEKACNQDKRNHPRKGYLCWEAILNQLVRDRLNNDFNIPVPFLEDERLGKEYTLWVNNLLGWKGSYIGVACPDLGKVLQAKFLKQKGI